MTSNPNQETLITLVAQDMLQTNPFVTTLAIKNELRTAFPDNYWFQSEISDVMNNLAQAGQFTYNDNGDYREYTLVNQPVSTSVSSTPQASTKPVRKARTKWDTESVSKTKAKTILENSKGNFMTVTFVEKDGTVRVMNCLYSTKMSQPNAHLGYILLKETVTKTPKNVNLQTLKEIKLNGVIYTVN